VAWVQAHLREAGIDTVLSGGSCVTYWSANAYRSDDIDLIPDGFGQRARIREVMLGLGFSEQNRYFVHARTALWVEFPAGPLAVGEERPRDIAERPTRTGMIRLLSATDCVKDRLAWWFHHQDRQCLEQAVAVAQEAGVDRGELARWAAGEHRATEFAAIAGRLVRAKRAGGKRRRS
jgi:hypothetical protein